MSTLITLIGEDERASLEHHLSGEVVLHDGGGEADARAAPARGVLRARRQPVHVRQQLRLGHAGVSHQADVDAASDLHS